MIKLNINAARIPGLTHAQYVRYVMDNHARLVLGTEPVARHLVSYVQQHVFDASYASMAPAWRFDSVSHIVARSAEDQAAAVSTPEYRDIIAPDEARFADGRSAMFISFKESPLTLPTAGLSRYRLLHYVKRAAHVTAADLRQAWEAAHSAALRQLPALAGCMRRAVYNDAQPGPSGEPACDAMGEIGFVQLQDTALVCDYAAAIESQLGRQIEASRSFYLLAEAFAVRGSLA